MKWIAMVIAVAIATIWTIKGASAAEAVIAIIRTGAFTLAQDQAISAHVVNTGEERGIIVDWRVLDSEGNVHAESGRLRVELGQTASFSWGGVEERMALRVELIVEGASRNHPGFIASLEVYNTDDGKTTVFLPYLE